MWIRWILILAAIALITAATEARPSQDGVDPERSLLESMIKKEQAALSGARLTPAERRDHLVRAIERNALEVGLEVKAKIAGPKKRHARDRQPCFRQTDDLSRGR